jgi:hypothetical protein
MRLSHPAFQLFSATLYEVVEQNIMPFFLAKIKKQEQFRKLEIGSNYVPVALRWTTHPEFGFPRQPFKVFRRLASYPTETLIRVLKDANEIVNITRTFPFGEEMYVLAVSCTVAPGQSLLLTPVGRDNVPMKAKAYRMETSGSIIFKAPFMKGILCEGLGWVNDIVAVPMQGMLQSPEWQHIQTVGLPFKDKEVLGQGYESDPQGFVGAEVSGEEAGLMRLQMGEWLFLPPNSINAADGLVPDVNWRHPRADKYRDMLRDEQLKMIGRCLHLSDDFSFDRSRRQPAYLHKMTIPGIDQLGSGNTPKDAHVVIPVVQHTVLSVSNESPAALGLGFGTYDFIPMRNTQPSVQSYSHMTYNAKMVMTQNFMGFDYMVAAQYTIRPFGEFKLPFLDDLSQQIEFCALNDERSRPVTPAELQAFGLQMNRPDHVDEPYTESVKLRWGQSNVPHGFGIASSYKPAQSQVLNDPYAFGGASYQNFFTPVPKIDGVQQDTEDIGKFIYIGTDEPVPFYGSEAHKYFIAGWDVFGRWTPWTKCGYTSTAPAPQQPGIMAIHLNVSDPEGIYDLSPTEPFVDSTLEIEFGWDWIDRTPSEIQIAGRFFDAALTDAPVSIPAGFSTDPNTAGLPHIRIVFSSANPNDVPTTNLGTLCIVQSNTPASSDTPAYGSNDIPSANLKRYKLIIPGIKSRFTGLAPHQVAYSAFIRGLERVRVPANGWSSWESGYNTRPDGTVVKEGGYITRLADPRPPAVTTFPAEVLFTAVPDAAKIARGKLDWDPAAGALAYHLWEASETAIRVALEKKLKEKFPADPSKWLKTLSVPLVERATQLRDLLGQTEYAAVCQRAFSRLSKEPITNTHYELSLPGSSDGLFLYQLNSVNSANIEGGKSNVIFFAVPKVVIPSAPLLQVRPYKKRTESDPEGEGLEIKVVTTLGEEPAGYHLYRTRKKVLGNDPGMKGLPVLEHEAPEWTDTTMSMLDGTQFQGKMIRELGITRSWKPLVYQAVAIGKTDGTRGRIGGESEGSTTEVTYFPPATAPTLINTSNYGNAFSTVFLVRTNAPFDKIELGKTIVDVYTLGSNHERVLLRSFVAGETACSAGSMSPATNAAEAGLLPAMQYQPTDKASGITGFSLCLAGTAINAIVRITDPLNRFTEIQIQS